LGLVGCGDPSTPATSGTPSELFKRYRDVPVGQSIVPVAQSLRQASLFFPIAGDATHESTTLQLRVSQDKFKRTWAYAFTTADKISKAFPEGGNYAQMPFADAFKMIEGNSSFGGIFINAGSEDSYVIPCEVFSDVRRVLNGK
jgi:hypothetical protein